MILRKLTVWLLALVCVGLFTSETKAAVIVSVQATMPYINQTGTNVGTFTLSRTGTTSSSVTVQLALSGTAVAGTDFVAIPTNITLAANVVSSNIQINLTTNPITTPKTVVLSIVTNSAYFLGLYTNDVVTLLPLSSRTNSVQSPAGRYWRGSGSDPTYWSQVVPLDYETGTVYSNLNGNALSLYGLTNWTFGFTLYQYNATNSLSQTNYLNRIPFNNPIVAFGERVGGTPLYINQPYSFGVYDGTPIEPNFVIAVFNRTNFSRAGFILLYPPISLTQTNYLFSYYTNGFVSVTATNYLPDLTTVTTNSFGLSTTLNFSPGLTFGATASGAFELTHTATAQATNYYYLVEQYGYPNYPTITNAMTIGNGGELEPSLMYTLEFEARPPWRSVFIDQPHFDGNPLPPFYAGKSVAEMLTNTPPVTNVVSFTPSAATNLDDSPELRRHPILDNFVASMNNDPIALANYVLNQIDLTDPMGYSDNGNTSEQSIDPGGVSRGALGTFLEKQGSPIEQCALLVYLLRQAGVPAVYEFAPRNGMQILDARLSRMLKFQVQGGFNEAGLLYNTNTMIPVNYPWVAAYIGTNWVHIFPWLKDYEINEGLNLYDEMPTNYSTAYNIVRDYMYGKTNLLSLAVGGDNTLRVILPNFLQQTLLQNHPGISADDIGEQVVNRQHYYSRWEDFPTPTLVTNVSTSLESLTSGITNISPTLTNVFDTISVEVYSQTNPAEDIQTGDLRLCDLHNREFYINQVVTNSNVQLNLILMPFRPSVTTQSAFTNDANLLSKEVLSLNLGSTDDNLGVRFRYHHHQAISLGYPIDPYRTFLGFGDVQVVNSERPLRKGDEAAICIDHGRVTHEMLNVHAEDIWQMENALRTNSAFTNSVSPDVYQGATMYLAGMSYYQKLSEFQKFNEHLHKMDVLSTFGVGLSKMEPARNSSGGLLNGKIDPVLPAVDMFYYFTAFTGNQTLRPDSGQPLQMSQQNFGIMEIADGSAEEHQVINRFYQQTNAVSTVRLLQKAGTNIVALNYLNYVTQGAKTYAGQALSSWDSSIWSAVVSGLQANPGLDIAYMTPGPVTNAAYKGVAAMILGWGNWTAAISPSSLNGGFGENLPSGTFSPANTTTFDLTAYNDVYAMILGSPTAGTSLVPSGSANNDFLNTYNLTYNGTYALSGYNTLWSGNADSQYGLSLTGTQNQVYAVTFQTTQPNGDPGPPNNTSYSWIMDPVSPITGEFYVHETDLSLPGPLPLDLSRHYSSQNLADNQFGAGWKLNIMPYMTFGSGTTNIFAAEMDGSVYVYVRTATNSSVWVPTTAANPQMNNDSGGVGGLVNRLRNRIVQSINGSTTNYTLYGCDGSVRAFQVMSFNNGILNQTRPYLQQWTDNRGNFYTFTYGTDPTQPNFGDVIKIQCSNGNFLGFDYDVYNHIVDAYTGDGRWLYYDYDQYGDLVTVTLPDSTTRSYQYQLGTQAVTNGTAFYSTHLIIEEDKPDGRALINAYDAQRRVTNQLSTAGVDLNPIRTATFSYTNNFKITNSYTTPISGYTLIIDGNGYTNRYDYTNDLITKITDPLGQTTQQTWYSDSATAPGYPRSLATVTDKRGLVTQYQYDGNGNLTNAITTGDLTGDGITSQTATNTTVYNTNCLPVQGTDPAGNSIAVVYDGTYAFLPQQIIRYAGASAVSTNYAIYGSATNVVLNGNLTLTNVAFGLPVRQIRAFGSTEAATNDMAYNGNGFLTQMIQYTGTADPNVPTTYFYNERGQMVDKVDALGGDTFMDYDAMNRPTETENFDEFGNPLSWSFNYYNDNGELNWVDGPRFNPEDYIFYDYDGEGRVTTEIHWLSQANSDGSGVSAATGYNLYAQTFYQYDPLGNLTLKVDPRGAYTTNTYDALCRLVSKTSLNFNTLPVLSSEGYGYEPGGQVKYYTNALGGVTTKLYTAAGKPEFQSNPDGSTNAWRYYLDGRIKREIHQNGAYWQTTYDDYNRITTRIFYSASGTPLATNSTQLDRRGNVVQKIDEGGNVFTNSYDGLDRIKITAGPSIPSVSEVGSVPNSGVFVTNILQQVSTNFYDAAGRVLTNINALGEMKVTASDAIGRVTSIKIYNAGGGLVRETYTGYSIDHNSVTVTNGSGSNAVVNTTFTDTEGNTAVSIAYPAPGVLAYTWKLYDLAGKMYWTEHDTSSGGIITTNTTLECFYDAMLRLATTIDRDGVETDYLLDGMGNVTNRYLLGNLQYQASYNNSGRMVQEKNIAGSAATRTNNYSYYASSSPFAGLLQSKTDGRGVSCTYSYDDWLRTTNMACTGALPEQNSTTAWKYDARGLVTSLTEQFASTNTGPASTITRAYDPYGQLASESVGAGSAGYYDTENWDAAGRRTMLNYNGATYGFMWQADGSMVSASDPTGGGIYTYNTAGLLTSRTVANRITSINSRDGEGRPLSISTTVNLLTQLTESLTWSGDGLLTGDTMARADFTDSRSYSYANLTRRLVQEQLNLNGSARWTNTLVYDQGAAGGLGVLSQMGQSTGTSNEWSGGVDAFSRVSAETNSTFSYAANGHVNGQSTLSGWLDGQPISVTAMGTNAMLWRAGMDLTPGAHQLKVAALHPSGFYTAWATNSFTNNLAYQATTDSYDAAGNVTNRVWKSPSGAVERTQTLSWDAHSRLHSVTDRDASNSGYNWTAVYDAMNRRLQTTIVLVSNGAASTASPQTINQTYDPQVEFMELGVSYGNQIVWKLYGPDWRGRYGSMNGTAALDGFSPYLNLFYPVITSLRGDILAEVTNSVTAWLPTRTTGYGAVPGYRPMALEAGADIIQASAWRGRWADITGLYNIGLRPYDPVAGRWLTYDSLWNEQDPNYFTFCGGDPINSFDSDGRISKLFYGGGQYNPYTISLAFNLLGTAFNQAADNSGSGLVGGSEAFLGNIFTGAGTRNNPDTYINGLQSFGHNIGSYYQDYGFWAAAGYTTSSWNVGQIYSGAANFNLQYDAAGQPIGDSWARWTTGLNGVASTATVAAGGLGVWNWATAPATTTADASLQGIQQYSEPIGPTQPVAPDTGMDPNILSGHGGLVVGDSSPVLQVPSGTSVTVWTEHGNTISDALGNAIETGGNITIDQFPEAAGARSYLPGSFMPNYTLYPPDWNGVQLNILGNPTTVVTPTPLGNLIGPGLGNVNWAGCLEVVPK